MFDDTENTIRVYGYVGDQTESFWCDVLGNGRASVRNLLAFLPIGFGDEIEYRRDGPRNVLVRLVRRSSFTTIAIAIEAAHEDDLASQAEAESARQSIAREFERRGAEIEGGMGVLLIAQTELTKEMVLGVAEQYVSLDSPSSITVQTYLLSFPEEPIDIDIREPDPLPEANPIPLLQLGGYLGQPVISERYDVLVESGDIPNGIDLMQILHTAANSAAFDPRVRSAWVDGRVDAFLVMGARLLGVGLYPLAEYPASVFETFTFQAPNWPKES